MEIKTIAALIFMGACVALLLKCLNWIWRGNSWCYFKGVQCSANNCVCWEEEQKKRRADLDRQREGHDDKRKQT